MEIQHYASVDLVVTRMTIAIDHNTSGQSFLSTTACVLDGMAKNAFFHPVELIHSFFRLMITPSITMGWDDTNDILFQKIFRKTRIQVDAMIVHSTNGSTLNLVNVFRNAKQANPKLSRFACSALQFRFESFECNPLLVVRYTIPKIVLFLYRTCCLASKRPMVGEHPHTPDFKDY